MSKLLDSEREALRVNRSLNDSGPDRRDHELQLAAVRDRGSASAHEPRRVSYPNLCGPARPLLDRVGGSK
jgi:hypothetical protein